MTIFGSSAAIAQLNDDEMLSYDTLVAKEKLAPITGRIIKVIKSPTGVQFTNVCSGVLISENQIVTAAHCFKVKPIFVGWDKITKRIKQAVSSESYYFDIPGVTSKTFYEEALKIAGIHNESGQMNVKISARDGIKLQKLLNKLPKIKRALYPLEYLQNMPTVIASKISFEDYRKQIQLRKKYPVNYAGSAYDYAIAELDRSIQAKPLYTAPLTAPRANTSVYVAGFFGASLEKPLQVFKCEAGAHVLDDLQRQADMTEFSKLKAVSHQLVITNCDGEIISGVSGGPQVVLRNGEIYLVGVTSGQLFSTYKYAVSPKAHEMSQIPWIDLIAYIP